MTPPGETARGIEIEIKLPADDLDRLRERLRALGSHPTGDRHFESNDLYDRDGRELTTRGCALRLRKTDRGAVLTFKGPARFEDGAKKRVEHETAVSDPEATERILAGVGLIPRFRYEKWREDWALENCVIALDETPIGDFIEIEGEPTAIRRALQRLALDWSESIPYSYPELYARRRREDPSLPEDMVFEER